MAFDGVPWMIGGDQAVHSADVGRQLAYMASSGAAGVTLPTDLHTKQLATPGSAVRIARGGGVIPNTYPGAVAQSYVVRNPEETEINVPATGSGGGATRYVIVRVDDPQFNGGRLPDDPAKGPYVFPELVSTLDGIAFPYIPLCKIEQPKNTATITNAMITDMREVAVPRAKSEMRTYALLSGDRAELKSSTGGDGAEGGQTWPRAVEDAWGEMEIPSWATRMKIVMMWAGARAPAGNAYGTLWVQVAPTVNPDHFVTQTTMYNGDATTDSSRHTLVVADNRYIPKALRGTKQKIYPRGNRNNASKTGMNFSLDGVSSMVLQVEFMERADPK